MADSTGGRTATSDDQATPMTDTQPQQPRPQRHRLLPGLAGLAISIGLFFTLGDAITFMGRGRIESVALALVTIGVVWYLVEAAFGFFSRAQAADAQGPTRRWTDVASLVVGLLSVGIIAFCWTSLPFVMRFHASRAQLEGLLAAHPDDHVFIAPLGQMGDGDLYPTEAGPVILVVTTVHNPRWIALLKAEDSALPDRLHLHREVAVGDQPPTSHGMVFDVEFSLPLGDGWYGLELQKPTRSAPDNTSHPGTQPPRRKTSS